MSVTVHVRWSSAICIEFLFAFWSGEKPFECEVAAEHQPLPPSLEKGTKRPDYIRTAFDQFSSITFLSVIDRLWIPKASRATCQNLSMEILYALQYISAIVFLLHYRWLFQLYP